MSSKMFSLILTFLTALASTCTAASFRIPRAAHSIPVSWPSCSLHSSAYRIIKFSLAAFLIVCFLKGNVSGTPSEAPAKLTLNLHTATDDSYTAFMNDLRVAASDKERSYYGIPMLPPPPSPPSYHLVELKATDDVSVTLAVNKSDLYVVGYCDQYQGNYRAHFFTDAPPNVRDQFKEAKPPLRLTIPYKSNYIDLEKKGENRRKLGLGIGKLMYMIQDVNNHVIDRQRHAKFLLLAIQIVSEAARFKYIQQQIIQHLEEQGFTPDYKVLDLENNWSTITKAIRKSTDGTFSPLNLKDASGKPWIVTKVDEIAPDMGLLSFNKADKQPNPLLMKIY